MKYINLYTKLKANLINNKIISNVIENGMKAVNFVVGLFLIFRSFDDNITANEQIVKNPIKNIIDLTEGATDNVTLIVGKNVSDAIVAEDLLGIDDGLTFTYVFNKANLVNITDILIKFFTKPFSHNVDAIDSGGKITLQDYCSENYFASDYVGTTVTF